jgi:ABC-type transporter Mla MlaB component
MTLRITVTEEPEATTMKLEGKVVGPWVAELNRAWRSLMASLGSKKLRVDLRGIDRIDPGGTHILAEIHRQTGANFLADSPITKYFAEQARLQSQKDSRERE